MEDREIIDLYWNRSEAAIGETAKKYSRYCYAIAFHILHDRADAEECVNDTYFRAWNAMPPHRPGCLSAFLGKIVRNLSLDRYKKYTAQKRGYGQMELALSELDICIPSHSNVEKEMEERELTAIINEFLENLPKEKRVMFVRRYWYLMPIKEIASQTNTGESRVKSALFRMRNELKYLLEKEGAAR